MVSPPTMRSAAATDAMASVPAAGLRKAKPRILSIQAFRGIAAMLVAFFHLHHVENKYFTTHTMDPFQYGWMGVDLFFVISGVVISLVTIGKIKNRASSFRFLYHRLARIYPTYWAYYAIIAAAYLLNPSWISAATGHRLDLLPSFFLIPCYSQVVGQAWSLCYELYFYCAFFFILLLIPERYVFLALAGWGGTVALIDCFQRVPGQDYVLVVVTDSFLFEFLAGCLLLHLFRRFELSAGTGGVLMGLSIAWFGAFVVLTNTLHGGSSDWLKDSYWIRPLFCGVTGFLFLMGAMVLERSGSLSVSKALSNLGDWSYSIYLSHQIVIELIGRGVARFFHSLPYGMIIVEVISLPAVILVGYCSYTWIERPVLTWLYNRSES